MFSSLGVILPVKDWAIIGAVLSLFHHALLNLVRSHANDFLFEAFALLGSTSCEELVQIAGALRPYERFERRLRCREAGKREGRGHRQCLGTICASIDNLHDQARRAR